MIAYLISMNKCYHKISIQEKEKVLWETVMIAEYFRDEGQKIGEMSIETVKPLLNQLESHDLLELSTLILDYDKPEPIYNWIDERVKSRTNQK